MHLMGNYIIQPEPYDSDDDSDFYSGEDDYSELYGDEMDDEFSELDDEEGPSACVCHRVDAPELADPSAGRLPSFTTPLQSPRTPNL